MEPEPFTVESKRTRIERAYHSYKSGTVRLVHRDLGGFTHLVASRHGLFAARPGEFRLLAHGFFFGLTLRDDGIYLFEACDQPHAPTTHGRIVRLARLGDEIVSAEVLCQGLDNGCHAMDFIHGRLCLTDTYNQKIIRFTPGEHGWEEITPLPTRPERWLPDDPLYRHLNSVLAVGEHIALLLHNGAHHTGRNSEIAICNREWQEIARLPLDGTGCHSLALLPGGTLLTCGSMEGNLITPEGLRVHLTPNLTRGLAVGTDGIAVGSSMMAERDGRLMATGTLTFLDNDYRIQSVLDVPGAPMEVRRLDAQDASLSGYLAGKHWAQALKPQYLAGEAG